MSFTVTSEKGELAGFRTFRQADSWAQENAAPGWEIKTVEDFPLPEPEAAPKIRRSRHKADSGDED